MSRSSTSWGRRLGPRRRRWPFMLVCGATVAVLALVVAIELGITSVPELITMIEPGTTSVTRP